METISGSGCSEVCREFYPGVSLDRCSPDHYAIQSFPLRVRSLKQAQLTHSTRQGQKERTN